MEGKSPTRRARLAVKIRPAEVMGAVASAVSVAPVLYAAEIAVFARKTAVTVPQIV